MKVAVLGASINEERFSNMAIKDLLKYGHNVVPVHPSHPEIEGIPTVSSLDKIHGPIDTLTIYVGPKHIDPLIPSIIKLNPLRVILNPGTSSPTLMKKLNEHRIPYIEACTLVMLKTKTF